jgi:predicted tellurium resistance membrane protein TerC
MAISGKDICIVLAYVIELMIIYAVYFLILNFIDRSRYLFMANLSIGFTIVACLISRPKAPHVLVRYTWKWWIGLVFLVNVVFGVFTSPSHDYASLIPGLAMMSILGSLAECFRRSKEKKQIHEK